MPAGYDFRTEGIGADFRRDGLGTSDPSFRIQVSDNSSGPVYYTFDANPVYGNFIDSPNLASFDPIYDPIVYSKLSFDNRERVFTWNKYPASNSKIISILGYFRPIEGQVKYFNFKDLEATNERWPTSDTWKKARIIAIETTPRRGGRLVYNTVTLRIQPEK